MTDLGTEQTPASNKDAKAQAKAAKAYAKATRPWFKKKRFILPIGVVAIAAMAAAGGGDEGAEPTVASASGTESGSDAKEASAPEATPGVNDAVRDGKFEFTVKKVDCGKTQIGTSMFGTKAQGQFCLVNVKVENIGDEAQSMFGDNQLMFDQEGREFSADTEAAIYMDNAQTLWEEINPGNSINGVVVFDVPKNAIPSSIELHDSMFSDGVTVSLTK
ncbi:MAG TPA: DUF4352 domain-containing protein [Nocardioidaceae bacterium]|nr:DUF4352 domain-containing protein [Nocardioidaceae bacterium]